MKTKHFFAAAMAVVVGLVSCSPTQPDETVSSVTLNHTALQIQVGETAQLIATVTPEGVAEVEFASSNAAVAIVDNSGLVTALSAGDTYIVASAGGKQATCKVTVFEEGQTLVIVSPVSAKLEVGQTVQLTAMVQPEEKAELVVWTSQNEAVATVDATGLVTAIAKGDANIVATVEGVSAQCVVTVSDPTGNSGDKINHVSLEGTNYYIFQLGGIAADQVADRIVADFREDGSSKFFYIWPNTGDSYIAGETYGKNFYGESEGWPSLTVGNIGWSGMGYNCTDLEALNSLAAIMDEPENYYLHLAMKSTDDGSHQLYLDGTSGSAKIGIGTAAIDGIAPIIDFARDGEWHEMEFCMQDLLAQGLVYGNNNTEALNVFGFLSGGVSGKSLQYDAAFIYKKKQ